MRKFLLVCVVLFTLFCLYLCPATLGGRALLPADVLFTDPVWQAQAPADFVRPANALLVDQIYQFYPWRVFAKQELLQNRLPLWNPYVYSGTPFIANDQSAVFYPINLLLWGLPGYLIPGWSACLRLLVAALGMYVLLQTWQKSVTASLIAGVAFALGSFTIPLLGHPHTNVGVWLPWMILTADQIVFSQHPWRWVGAGGIVIGVQFLGGHAETSFFVLMVWGLYSVVSLWKSGLSFKAGAEKLGMLALSFLLGGALGAVQLAPFLELLPQSNYFLHRTQTAQAQPLFYAGFWRNSAMLITTLFPNFFGNPTTDNWWIGTGFSNYTGVLYMGILPLFVAGFGAWRQRKEWRVAFFALLGVLWLGVLGRWPIIDWVRRLPLLNVTAFSLVVYCFCVAVLAGLVFDQLWEADHKVLLRRFAVFLTGFAGLSGLGLGSVYLILRFFKTSFLRWGETYVETQVYGRPSHPYPLDYYLAQLEDRYRQIVSAFDPTRAIPYIPTLIALGGALVLWALWKKQWSTQQAKRLFLLLIVIDLWAFGSNFNPTLPPTQILPETPALRLLMERQGYERIAVIGKGLPANTGMAFGLFDIRGYDVGIGRYGALLDTLERDTGGLLLTNYNNHIFNVLGVHYLLSATPLGEQDNLKLVYADEIYIYERTPLPRTYLTDSYQVITDDRILLEQMAAPQLVTDRQVLLETPPLGVSTTHPASSGAAQITVYRPNQVEITTTTLFPQLLVLSDAFYPGWKAFVDGRETPIYRANYAMRAVVVPAGGHKISFVYQPSSFYTGAWISLGSVGLLLLTAGVSWWKNKHRKQI